MKRFLLAIFAGGLICFPFTADAETAKAGWTDNALGALKTAKAEKKLLLMDFTGSDWCPFCVKMDKEVFSSAEFKEYAKGNLVLLELDFPQGKTLKVETMKQNEQLRTMFGVEGFPLLIVFTPEGKPVKAFQGMTETKTLLAELKKLKV